MQIKLTFLGAAQNVTGSRYMVETGESRVLVECGLYQERDLVDRNWDPFPVPPGQIDAVLLTHAHLDHCGLLPKLVREGFRGRIFCTPATAEIAQVILLDSAHIQEEDAQYKEKRHRLQGRRSPHPYVPLYTARDAEEVRSHYATVDYERPTKVAEGMSATFHDAGHVFGSSMISLRIRAGGQERTILFSGDVGRGGQPIIADPTTIDQADYVLVESTYGDRHHAPQETVADQLAEAVRTTIQAGGNLVIPAFALERSQDVLFHFNELLLKGRIPPVTVFLDSPMAIQINEIFQKHPDLFDPAMTARMAQENSPFSFPGLRMTTTVEESKAINHMRGPVVIIAGAGMCNGGRIKHHLANNISRPECTVLFVGYQSAGTLGRQITSGAREVRIHGEMYPVRARILKIGGLSAHADRDELWMWLSALKCTPRGVFVTHGEPESALSFGEFLRDKCGWKVSVPIYRQQFILD